MLASPYILHSSKATGDPRVSVQLLHYRLAHFEVVRVTCSLRVRIQMLLKSLSIHMTLRVCDALCIE